MAIGHAGTHQVTLENCRPDFRGDFKVTSDQDVHAQLRSFFRNFHAENFGILRISVGLLGWFWYSPDLPGTFMNFFLSVMR